MSERQRGQSRLLTAKDFTRGAAEADEKELGVLGHVFLALSPPLARPLGHRGRRA